MADVEKYLELLFDRPSESLITPKGDQKAVFQLNEQIVVSIFKTAKVIWANNSFIIPVTERGCPAMYLPAQSLPRNIV